MKAWNQIQRPELVAKLQQFFGTRQAHLTPTHGSEIVPVVIVGNLDAAARFSVRAGRGTPTGQRTISCAVDLPAGGVGNFGQLQIRNPVGSGFNLRMLFANVGSVANGVVGLTRALNTGGDLATGVSAQNCDSRFKQDAISSGIVQPVSVVTRGVTAVAPVVGNFHLYWNGAVMNNSPFVLGELVGLVLAPGDAWLLQDGTANDQLTVNLLWTEEPIAD